MRGRGWKEKDFPDNSFPIWLHIGPGTSQEVWRWQDLWLGTPFIDPWRTISLPWGGFSWCPGWEIGWGRHREGPPHCRTAGWFPSWLAGSWSWELDLRQLLEQIPNEGGGQRSGWHHSQRCQYCRNPQLTWFWRGASRWCCWKTLYCSTGLLGEIGQAWQGRHTWSERIHWGQRTARDRNHRTGHSSCQSLFWGFEAGRGW